MKKKIIIIGGGGHAHSCIDTIEQSNKFKIIGIVDKKIKRNSKIFGYSILGKDKDLKKISNKLNYALICVGQIKNSKIRVDLFKKAFEAGFKLPVVISKYAYVSPRAKIGKGTIVMHGAVVNANAIIGKNCIINTNSIIEHDVIVGDHCHVSTGAILNGGVILGKESFIGSGSVVKDGIKIGINSVVGANIFIRKHLIANTTVRK